MSIGHAYGYTYIYGHIMRVYIMFRVLAVLFLVSFSTSSMAADCSWMPSGDLACDEFRYGTAASPTLNPAARIQLAPTFIPQEPTVLMPDVDAYLAENDNVADSIDFSGVIAETESMLPTLEQIEGLSGCSQTAADEAYTQEIERIAIENPGDDVAQLEAIETLEFDPTVYSEPGAAEC